MIQTVCLDKLIYAGCPEVLFACPSVPPATLLWTFFVDDFFGANSSAR